MTATLERPRTAPHPVRSSRLAWLALLLTPALGAVAIWMSFFVLGDENIKWWGELIVAVLVVAPPIAGLLLGVRSALSGNRLGAHAAAVAAAWLAFWIMFWYLANYPYNSESGAIPLSVAAVTAVVVGAGVEGWYRLRGRRSGGLD